MAARIWRFLASTWLAVGVVAALVLLATVGSLLPQAAITTEADLAAWQIAHPLISVVARPVGLFHAFSSWIFLALVAALAVSLAACTVDRIVRRRADHVPWDVRFAGSMVLHLGLLVLMAGGLVTAAYRFDGTIVMTEGQTADLSQPQYVRLERGPLGEGRALPAVLVGLESFDGAYVDNKAVAIDSTISIADPGGGSRRVVVTVNGPVQASGYRLTQSDHGYSPHIQVVSPQGLALLDAYIALRSVGGGLSGAEDYVEAPGLPGRLMMRVYPDLVMRDGRPASASPQPRNPALEVRFTGSTTGEGKRLLLPPGESAALAGLNVTFTDLREWSAFRVTRDAGRPVVYGGFAICLIGLLVRFLPDIGLWVAARRAPGPSTGIEVGTGDNEDGDA